MDRRPLLLVAVAIVAGLLLVARCGQAGDDTAHEPPADSVAGVDDAGGAPGTSTGPVPADPPIASVPAADPHAPLESAPGDTDPVPTRPSPGEPAQPAALAAAEEFARAWVRTDSQWSTRLADLATADVVASLAGVDPTTVPATSVTGPGTVQSEVPGWASVAVPTDAGTVVLHVVQSGEAWLVSAIDWQPQW